METKEVKKLAEEVAGWKTKEGNPFAGFGGQDGFCVGSATDYLQSDSARPDQPVDVGLADI